MDMPVPSGGHADAEIGARRFEQRSSGWVPATQLAAELGVCRRTLARWLRDVPMGFPRPHIVNKRLYFSRDQIEAWKITSSVKSTEAS
jgi:hypothetical protein